MFKVAILDDYHQEALRLANWKPLEPDAQLQVFSENLQDVPRLAERFVISQLNSTPPPDHAGGLAVSLHLISPRSLFLLVWGLRGSSPNWCEDPKGGRKPINAKCETARTRPTFRDAYRRRRCIVPVDGFLAPFPISEWGEWG